MTTESFCPPFCLRAFLDYQARLTMGGRDPIAPEQELFERQAFYVGFVSAAKIFNAKIRGKISEDDWKLVDADIKTETEKFSEANRNLCSGFGGKTVNTGDKIERH